MSTTNGGSDEDCCQLDSVFSRIIRREIPGDFVYEDDRAVVIKDIMPRAPVHLLVIPKKQIRSVATLQDEDIELMGHLVKVARDVARQQHLDKGYRLVINTGEHACQVVFHLHIHILAGRQLVPDAG